MGTPRFYYYPDPGGSLTEGALNRSLTRLEQIDQPLRTDVYGGEQRPWVQFFGTRRRVRLVWERISLLTTAGRADLRTLQAVIAHLQVGGVVGFSADNTKTWCAAPGIGARVWSRGSTSLFTTANLLAAWAPLASIAAADEVVIESHPVYGLAEQRLVASWTSSTRTLALDSEKLVFDYQDTDPLLRWYRSWPALRLPADALPNAPIVNERGLHFDCTLTLEVEPQIHRVTSPQAGGGAKLSALGNTTSRLGGARETLESLLGVTSLSGAGGPSALRLRVR